VFDGDSTPYLEVPLFISASEDCIYVEYYLSTLSSIFDQDYVLNDDKVIFYLNPPYEDDNEY